MTKQPQALADYNRGRRHARHAIDGYGIGEAMRTWRGLPYDNAYARGYGSIVKAERKWLQDNGHWHEDER